ncbi:response regulator transcription factor [Nocardioides sp.]|uniref:response regulator transcription factor n=1 Tax=Nocardioides sp. TaxID=35761 RepID=UPI003D14F7BE
MPPDAQPIRIAVVDDYEVVVAGVASMFAGFRDRIEVVELDNQVPVVSDVDIVLLDTFALVEGRGLGLSRLVRPGGPKVVVFTWPEDNRSAASALDQGAVGHLSKAMPAQELVAALEEIHAGSVITRAPVEPRADADLGDWPGREWGLTPRESEVLALIAQGLSNQDIAGAIYVSINSVKSYIRSAYRKIGVERRSNAVLWALQHGFGLQPKRTFPPR